MIGIAAGFYGKLPTRGDFIQRNAAADTVVALDAWCSVVLAGSQILLGDRWRPAWMEAPIWRFRLPAGTCGPEALAGIWLPSIDRAGRPFPLILIVAGSALEASGGVMERIEPLGIAAVEHDIEPDALAVALLDAAIAAPAKPLAAEPGTWWTNGTARVAPTRHALPDLPNPAQFVGMLTN